MQAEATLDFPALVRELTRRGVRFVLFGRQAVRLYGSDCSTKDWDLWLEPSRRRDVLTWLEDELGFELSAPASSRRPVVTAWAGLDRLDLWFVRAMRNRDGVDAVFDEVHARSTVLEDPDARLTLRIPSVDDLIILKRMAPTPRAKDDEDIRWLLVRKRLDEDE